MLLAGCSRVNQESTGGIPPRPVVPAVSVHEPERSSGVAVVELFTSEGCSSCPAADLALARVARRAEVSGAPIFTVELHVDYWDYLGFRDPFDDARFSQRQAGYRHLGGSTYTPQAVVNGTKEAVGSDESRLSRLIEQALTVPVATRLTLAAAWDHDSLLVRCSGDGVEASQTLNLFVLEDEAESAVTGGENAGERLHHRNVARAFEARSVPGGHFQAAWPAPLPAGSARHGVSVLAFTERPHQAGITGAARAVPD